LAGLQPGPIAGGKRPLLATVLCDRFSDRARLSTVQLSFLSRVGTASV